VPALFDTYKIRGLTLRNRIVMAPMCTWMAELGVASDWHYVHYASRAIGGIGLEIVEASAVEPRGRIRNKDVGIWGDEHIEPHRRLTEVVKSHGASPSIQLAHAGRKSETVDDGAGPADSIAPSAIQFGPDFALPREMDAGDLATVKQAFVDAALRAVEAGYESIELHGAHGYLLSQFISSITNQREDEYGGGIPGRAKYPAEVVAAVREAIPQDMPLLVRVSGQDYVEGGNTAEDVGAVSRLLGDAGADMIHVSSAGITPDMLPIRSVFPGYQITLAETIGRESGLPTIAVGRITEPLLAEEVIRNERADLVALGRVLLREPYWPLRAAHELGVEVDWPPSYIQGGF
jgi:NADPH2 dehydrogenase